MMRLAMRLPSKGADGGGSDGGGDPREGESADVIDLASRNGFSAVADRKSKTDGLGLAAGVAIVALLGATTFWAMNAAELPETAPATGTTPGIDGEAVTSTVAPQPEPAVVAAPTEIPDPAPAPILASPPGTVPGTAVNPYATPSLVFDASRGAQPASVAEPAAGVAAPAPATGSGGAVGSAAAFASRVGGVGGATAQARPLVNPTTTCLLYTSPSPRDLSTSRMPSSA